MKPCIVDDRRTSVNGKAKNHVYPRRPIGLAVRGSRTELSERSWPYHRRMRGDIMDESQRDRFIKRISTVGAGLREDVQLALGVIVSDLRAQVIEGAVPDDEVTTLVALHDATEALWRATLSSTPPLRPEELVARLRELRDHCAGPTEGFRIQFAQVLEKAEVLRSTKKYR